MEGAVSFRSTAILADLAQRWIDAFCTFHASARLHLIPPFTPLEQTVDDLASGHAAAIFVSGEAVEPALVKFSSARGYLPLRFAVAGGSYDHFGFMDAGAVVVNGGNPLNRISFEQLRRIFSRPNDPSDSPPITRWGELGLKGAWLDAPIHPLLPTPGALERFMHDRINGVDYRWRDDVPGAQTVEIQARVEADPHAIGLSKLAYLLPVNKAVALSTGPAGPYYEADYETVAQGDYPLSRLIYLYVDPGQKPATAKVVSEFVRFIVSREGQRIVIEQGVFLPLRAHQVLTPE